MRVQRPGERLPRQRELAWRLAEVAADPAPVEPEVAEMVGNRLLDDVAVALPALDRDPPAAARAQALAHPRPGGAIVLGLDPAVRVAAEWAAWANGAAVRELDFHDTLPGRRLRPPWRQHPAAAGRRAAARPLRGRPGPGDRHRLRGPGRPDPGAIDLHSHRIDHVAHLGPSVAAGLGALLGLDPEVTYQAVNQALPLAMGAVEDGLRRLRDDGTQANLLDRMQTRARLYELLGYGDYTAFDQDVYNSQRGTP